MKLLRTLCVFGLAICLATSAYAGTQSVKISGDITIRSLWRDDYDLDHNHCEDNLVLVPADNSFLRAGTRLAGSSDWDTYFMTTTEVQIDADLTDNVAGVIRIYNQRDWNTVEEDTKRTFSARTDEFNIGIDLAYIELKEFLYSPLTLRIGRQDIWFGKGFIVGANRRDYNNNINAKEYTCANAFDAIRATLDYDPWTIDAMVAKIWENNIGSKDDMDLCGINVGYVFDVYNAEAEGYWFWKDDASTIPTENLDEHNTVYCLGLRGSADPIENWTVAAEGAYQFGDYVGYASQHYTRNRSAWALDLNAECRHFTEMFAWKPVVGLEYIFYSGDSKDNPNSQSVGAYKGWDSMFRGKYDSAIREWFGTYYMSAQGYDTFLATGNNPEDSKTNQHQLIVMSSVQPTDSLTLDARFLAFWQAERMTYDISGWQAVSATDFDKCTRYVGSELDLELTWDYTEDVSFGLMTAWFFPGSMYKKGSRDVATDVVGSVKLSF